tara:strand:+ start:477 stop:665 length:189 start_codon:yes stop_codon:yes gene_type:complete
MSDDDIDHAREALDLARRLTTWSRRRHPPDPPRGELLIFPQPITERDTFPVHPSNNEDSDEK